MRIIAICPLGREQDLPNVMRCWSHQSSDVPIEAGLVVVENGDAIGACQRAGFRPMAVLQSGAHQSLAKNAGLEFALTTMATHWATWDSDDYYGPGYLAELARMFSSGHDVVGKSESFVKLTDGRIVLCPLHGANRHVEVVQGPTLSSVLWPTMPMFNVRWEADGVTPAWGEDAEWCAAIKLQGKVPFASSRYHWCYMRFEEGQHTYRVTDEQLLWLHGLAGQQRERERVTTMAATRYLDQFDGVELFEAGEFSEGVVDKLEQRDLTPIATPDLDLILDNPGRPRPRPVVIEPDTLEEPEVLYEPVLVAGLPPEEPEPEPEAAEPEGLEPWARVARGGL